mgnify:CR=1 FL=1
MIARAEVFAKKTRATPEKATHDRVKKTGWTVGTTAEFPGVTGEEAALIEMNLALAHNRREHQEAQHPTQAQLAKMLLEGRSRLAKKETADSSVSMELLVGSRLMLVQLERKSAA